MKLKKYTAPSVREALIQVKQELGDDAVILRTEKVKTGALGGESLFEVTAAIDETAEPITTKPEVAPPRSPMSAYNAQTPLGKILQPEVRMPSQSEERPVEEAVAKQVPVVNDELTKQVQALRQEIRLLKGSLNKPEALEDFPEEFHSLVDQMSDLGVAKHLIRDLVAELILECPTDQRDENSLKVALEQVLEKKIPFREGGKGATKSRVLLFVGPTGVGKSTTIAKLAARETLGTNKKVAIVSTDAYRMGAIEQMDLFSKAADIDFEAVFDLQDIDSVLEGHQDKDLVLVDTAGRAKNHHQHMEELLVMKSILLPDEVHLVVSANTRDRDLEEVFHRFSGIGITQIAFTKVDETLEPGGLLNLPLSKGVPLSFLCNGQNIPDDLHEAEGKRVAQLVVKGVL